MIFSLLKIRKKTGAVIAGILIGMACLWGIALWQDIPPRQLLTLLAGSLLLVLAIMLLAMLLIGALKLAGRLLEGARNRDREDGQGPDPS